METSPEPAILRQKLLGTQNNYIAFSKLKELRFKNLRTPVYYSEPIEEQLKLDIKLLKEQISIINQQSLPDDIYRFLPLLGYSSGYTLLVHQLYFRLFEKYATKEFKDRDDIRTVKVIGGIFNQRIRTDLAEVNQAKRITGISHPQGMQIQMDSEEWFYSRFSNIHVSAAVVMVEFQGQTFPVYIRLRDSKGDLLPNVRTKFFGFNLSPQNLLIGFNLNGVIVPTSNYLRNGWKKDSFKTIRNEIERTELYLSLQDLYRSCYITICYTSMRRQFKTIPDSKQERRIIQYQGVASRIAEGLAVAFAISSLLNLNKPDFTEYYQFGHRVIFNQLMTLRECCGGFGYLKASGHPSLIERVALRTSEVTHHPILPIPTATLKQYSPYIKTTDQNILFEYSVNKPKSPLNYYFITAQYRFLEPRSRLQQKQYIYQFFKCCCIQQFQRGESWNSFRVGVISVIELCRYLSVVEGIKDSRYINLNIMKEKTKAEVLDTMIEMKRKSLGEITKHFEIFKESLPVLGTQDLILGREDENEFYEEVLRVSRSNYRNSKEFVDEVKKPVVEYLRNGNYGNL